MPIKRFKPITPGLRHRQDITFTHLSGHKPEKSLLRAMHFHAGRNNAGKVTVRHQGGRHKRLFREIDFNRSRLNIPAIVVSIEYDPNRTANIALLHYADGVKTYILAPQGLQVGQPLLSGENAPIKPGNALPLNNIPVGTVIHNIELAPGKGGQLVRSAGTAAILQSKDKMAMVKLPSGQVRQIFLSCYATIGEVGNQDVKNIKFGKAGRKRHLGIRPSVRGVAQNPHSHPHGGGEGRSGIGRSSPMSPWGKKTLGKKTRRLKKYSNQYIIKSK